MKSTFSTLLLVLSLCTVYAQDCVEIERILVDACTLGSGCQGAGDATCNCEGMNEMFTFRVGQNPLNVDDLTVVWPNNSFLGFCQDAQTAANVEALNASIEACGELIEPENGFLPAGAQVLVVTSSNMCTEANSFTGLNETLYIIFQCPGNYTGHFANHGTGLRTLTVSFGAGCFDTATYDRSLLVTQAGTAGAEDGATVDFTEGSPSYYNDGCNAPVELETFSAGPNTNGCAGSEILLSGLADGNYTDLQWLGGDGDYSNPTEAVTLYTPAPDESGTIVLTLTAESCNGPVSDEVNVTVIPLPVAGILPEDPPAICPGEPLELQLVGESSGTWSTGENASSITVSEPGTYTVAVQNLCGEASASVEVLSSELPFLEPLSDTEATLCNGEAIELSVLAEGELFWSTGESSSTIQVDEAGTYNVSASTECGSLNLVYIVTDGGATPTATINNLGADELCADELTTLEALGTGDVYWSTGEVASVIEVPFGSYELTISNACGSASDVLTIEELPSPNFDLQVLPSAILCAGESVFLQSSGGQDLTWSDGSVASSIEVDSPGVYSAEFTTVCGTFAASMEVEPSAVQADFLIGDFSAGAPLEIGFTNTSQGASFFEWWVNNQLVAETTNLSRFFSQPDTYEVLLLAIDAGGCVDSVLKSFDLPLVDDRFFVPNAFTPDQDGMNDVFRVVGPPVNDFRLLIMNRWGDVVYESRDQYASWQGEYQGGAHFVPNDVYTWVLTYEGVNKRERQIGHVNILR